MFSRAPAPTEFGRSAAIKAMPSTFILLSVEHREPCLCHECRRSKRRCATAWEMKDEPSGSPCRRGSQTTMSCFGQKTVVVNVMEKARARLRHVGVRETSASEPLPKHRNPIRRHQNRGLHGAPRSARRQPTYWPCGVRCAGGVTLIRALVRNVRTWPAMPRERLKRRQPQGRKYRCAGEGRTAS